MILPTWLTYYVITLARKGAARPFEHRLHLEMDNFDAVKSGAKVWRDIDVNIRLSSLNFGVRAGDEEDYQWIEEQMFDAIENGGDFEIFATALRRVSQLRLFGP